MDFQGIFFGRGVFSISLLLMSARVHAYVVRTSGRTKFACIQGRNLVATKRLAMLNSHEYDSVEDVLCHWYKKLNVNLSF
jgi:hypothetical protein